MAAPSSERSSPFIPSPPSMAFWAERPEKLCARLLKAVSYSRTRARTGPRLLPGSPFSAGSGRSSHSIILPQITVSEQTSSP